MVCGDWFCVGWCVDFVCEDVVMMVLSEYVVLLLYVVIVDVVFVVVLGGCDLWIVIYNIYGGYGVWLVCVVDWIVVVIDEFDVDVIVL